ncbi:hypothetical protein BKA64DRAFT_655162 [Cadophora sp. MPI-SDFR-AT-0126]|nr:hypothetical protein BKA64DRAFT_655162 [Leotiomycetes sp. MPI-SDFR-AT-0126]
MESEQYKLFTSTGSDNIELAKISIAAFKPNALFYLTHGGDISSDIKIFHRKDMIEFYEGEKVETIKVVADHLPDKPIVAFAIYFYGPEPPNRGLKAPEEADFKFKDEVKKQTQEHKQFYRENKDIKVHLMCVSPQYQRKGIGSMLVNYIQARAIDLKKRVFLQATPAGASLYLKHEFELLAEAKVDQSRFGGEGTYVQSTMRWDASNKVGVAMTGFEAGRPNVVLLDE